MQIFIQTKKAKEVVDITETLEGLLRREKPGKILLNLFVSHTTCALATADLDPGTSEDMLDAFTEMVPKLSYRHPHDPKHAPDHIMSTILGPSLTIPVENGSMVLGTWQRVVLIEFAGPRKRRILVNII